MNRNLYGIMIKYPEPGKVKTRLAEAIGNKKAAEVYRCLAERIMNNTRPSFLSSPFDKQAASKAPYVVIPAKAGIQYSQGLLDCPIKSGNDNKTSITTEMMFERIVFYDPPERLPDFEAWFPGEGLIQQSGSDVGERMDNVIRDLLGRGAKKTVITGADIPELTSMIIMEAFAALDSADIVIGPAKDGGYYLIGMKAPHPEIFQNIPWSTDRVFEETMKAIERLQLRCNPITTLSDLDTADDYKRLIS